MVVSRRPGRLGLEAAAFLELLFRFLGVAQISVKPEYFLRLYGDLSGIAGSSVTLVNANGGV